MKIDNQKGGAMKWFYEVVMEIITIVIILGIMVSGLFYDLRHRMKGMGK